MSQWEHNKLIDYQTETQPPCRRYCFSTSGETRVVSVALASSVPPCRSCWVANGTSRWPKWSGLPLKTDLISLFLFDQVFDTPSATNRNIQFLAKSFFRDQFLSSAINVSTLSLFLFYFRLNLEGLHITDVRVKWNVFELDVFFTAIDSQG